MEDGLVAGRRRLESARLKLRWTEEHLKPIDMVGYMQHGPVGMQTKDEPDEDGVIWHGHGQASAVELGLAATRSTTCEVRWTI